MFWGSGNVGDTLSPSILEAFTKHKAERAGAHESGKLLMCGSIVEFALPGDTIVGSGSYTNEKYDFTGVNIISFRGKHTGKAPLYGSPALVLPLIYNPKVPKKREVGYIPHLWDGADYPEYISVKLDWKRFVWELLSCERIVTTSLHGFILANAYGIPAEWVESKRVPGARIKYEDYLSGIDQTIEKTQENVLKALAKI